MPCLQALLSSTTLSGFDLGWGSQGKHKAKTSIKQKPALVFSRTFQLHRMKLGL